LIKRDCNSYWTDADSFTTCVLGANLTCISTDGGTEVIFGVSLLASEHPSSRQHAERLNRTCQVIGIEQRLLESMGIGERFRQMEW
jgi:hypothetical protein